MHLEPGVDERADQPGPHRALVIGRVARAQVAVVVRLVVGIARRERAQADRRQQAFAHHVAAPAAQRSRDRAPDAAARSRTPGWAGTPDRRRRPRHRPRRRDSRRSAYQKRSLNDRCARSARAAQYVAASSPLFAQPSRSSRRSALYQSALISTALPRRGVTTQSPTLASIQVS